MPGAIQSMSPRCLSGAAACLLGAVAALAVGLSARAPAEENGSSETAAGQAGLKTGAPEEGKLPVGKDLKWKVTRPDPAKPVEEADNSYCLVCHVNLEEEELVDIHLAAGVGCETCHGLSEDHSADEDGLTAPEIMWGKPRINPRCMTCHPREELLVDKTAALSHREMFLRWEEPAKAKPGEKYCIQCHGEHRIAHRTRVWDQESGKLLKRAGGPAMDR